jgi:hypothetical protein
MAHYTLTEECVPRTNCQIQCNSGRARDMFFIPHAYKDARLLDGARAPHPEPLRAPNEGAFQ